VWNLICDLSWKGGGVSREKGERREKRKGGKGARGSGERIGYEP
jgi:hypothetical protein